MEYLFLKIVHLVSFNLWVTDTIESQLQLREDRYKPVSKKIDSCT